MILQLPSFNPKQQDYQSAIIERLKEQNAKLEEEILGLKSKVTELNKHLSQQQNVISHMVKQA